MLAFCIMACGSPKVVHTEYTNQLDSIFKAENILTYDSIAFQDYETKEWFYEYYFIRDSLVLRWTKDGKIIKRIDK